MALNRYEAEYRSHELWALVRSVLERIEGARAGSPEQQDSLDRIRFVLGQLRGREDQPDLMVSRGMLDQAASSVAQVNASLRRWEANGGSPQYLLQAAGPQLDALLDAIRGWPSSRDSTMRAATKTLREFASNAASLVSQLREEVQAQSETISRMVGESAERLQRADQFQVHLERSTEEALARIDSARADLMAKANEIDKRSFEKESAQRVEFGDWLSRQEETFAELLEQAQILAKDSRDEAEKSADSVLGRIRELERQAKNLVGVIGVDSTSTDFGNYADAQRKAANRLRWGAIGAFVGAFVLFFVTYALVPFTADIPWQGVVLRSVASLALLAGGVYLARESAQHRREERETRATQLRLAALEPFVVNMSAKERSAIRASTANRVFGPAVIVAEEATTLELSEEQQKKLLEALTDAIAKIVSRS